MCLCWNAALLIKQNKPDPEKGLNAGGSVINVASFVAIMGAATPQIACTFSLSHQHQNLNKRLVTANAHRHRFEGRRACYDT